MAKKLSLIAPMWDFVVGDLVNEILAIESGEDIILYQSTPGGSVFAGWALAGVMKEHKGNITIKALGSSSSMGFYNLLYADNVEALNVTRFTIHRADGYVETEDDRKQLNGINSDLRAAMESKIDEAKFKRITGKTFDDIFNSEERLNVTVSAKDLKKLGVVDTIIQLNDKEVKALSGRYAAFSEIFDAEGSTEEPRGSGINEDAATVKVDKNKQIVKQKNAKMTKEEFKAQFPDAYKEIVAEGVAKENDRASAIMVFAHLDLEACRKMIKDGENPSQTFISEMSLKAMAPKEIVAATDDSPGEVKPGEEIETQSPEDAAAKAEFDKNLAEAQEIAGIKGEVK